VQVMRDHQAIDEVRTIYAGKWRRYHGQNIFVRLLDLKTAFFNVRDIFLIILGTMQSRRLMRKLKPSVVFIKGGFVGVPVGKAAGWRRIPYVTHDSDALAGLANRLIAKKAAVHTVALPKELYKYPQDKTFTVGVPIAREYGLVNNTQMQSYRIELGLQDADKIVFVTGGGLGAQIINETIAHIAGRLLEQHPGLYIIHNTGRLHGDVMRQAYAERLSVAVKSRLIVKDYLTDMYRYSGAADIVVSRAGATAMAEFAAQGKPVVVVPNPILAGGHQMKNAEAFIKAKAVRIASEKDLRSNPDLLMNILEDLLENPGSRAELGRNLHAFTHETSAKELAEILLKVAKKK